MSVNVPFERIGLVSRRRTPEAKETLLALAEFLTQRKKELVLEAETAKDAPELKLKTINQSELGKHCDLAIVVGGDGSLLHAAHSLVNDDIPVLGINRGRLGFLTDIPPQRFQDKIDEILAGHYDEEQRFLLTASVKDERPKQSDTLNDVVISTGSIARMIEFEVAINGQFVYSQRSDGLIIATPTGSTAYALSGGGPILHPSLDAIVLVPMFPHTLTSRPIVIDSNSSISITITSQTDIHPVVSLDGHTVWSLDPGSQINIQRKTKALRLLHPKDYDYFNVLRTKLQWGSKLEGQK